MAKALPVADRFWPKVAVAGDDECWEWLRSKNNKGYGKFSWGHSNWILAHKAAFFLTHGRWPKDELELLHSCDNPACCNPKHISEDTHSKNMRDAGQRGRFPKTRPSIRGENHFRAVFTWEIVGQIRSDIADGVPTKEVARMLGVSKSAVEAVWYHRTWKTNTIHT